MQQLMAVLRDVPMCGRVERNRRSAPDADDAPILIVYDQGHQANATDFGDTSYEMTVGIDGAVTATDDSGLGPAANELYAATIRVLMADFTLGDTVEQVREDTFDFRLTTPDESAAPLAFFSLNLTVQFRTADGHPYTLVE